jgi:WD40 repeat protein
MIGTDYGFVLRYDLNTQQFKLVIGANEKVTHKAVTSLSISKNGEVMACGHEDGTIVFWNIEKNDPFKTAKCHESPIVSLKFIGEKLGVVSLDAAGAIYYNSLTNVMFGYYCSTDKILDPNSKIPCLALEVFFSSINHPFSAQLPIAFSNTQETFIYTVDPIKLLGNIPKPLIVPPGSFPYLSWMKPSFPNDLPYLSIGWGTNLEVYSFILEGGIYKFDPLIKTNFDSNITGKIFFHSFFNSIICVF